MRSPDLPKHPQQTTPANAQELEDQIGRTLGAVRIDPEYGEFVRAHLALHNADYLAALDGLVASLRLLGASIQLTFWRCVTPDGAVRRDEPPFATMTATNPRGHEPFLIPNINMVLNPIHRDDIRWGSSKTDKTTITSAQEAESDSQSEIPSYPLKIEAFRNPVIIAVTTRTGRFKSWDEIGGATVPLEARVAYSDAALSESLRRIAQAARNPDGIGEYSHLFDEIVSPQAALVLNELSGKRFGLREELQVDALVSDPEAGRLVIDSHFTSEEGDVPITLKVHLVTEGAFLDAAVDVISIPGVRS